MNTVEKISDSAGAVFDLSGRYRYLLWREFPPFSESTRLRKTVSFVMLNPNQADEIKNDPTITRCARFAQDWGFSRLDVVNLFAVISPTPKDLIRAKNPVGKLNDHFVCESIQNADLIIAAWGNYGQHKGRSKEFVEFACQNNLKLSCLRVNLSGEPMHPLYVARKTKPIDFS